MNKSNAIDLTEEIEVRRRLREQYDLLARGLTVETPSDIEALARLLTEVRESVKSLTEHEKQIKTELKRHFADRRIIDLPSALVTLETRTRKDLDRERILDEVGQGFFDTYCKETSYEIIRVIDKGVRDGK